MDRIGQLWPPTSACGGWDCQIPIPPEYRARYAVDCPICHEEFETNELLIGYFSQLPRRYCLKHYAIKYPGQENPHKDEIERSLYWEKRFVDMGLEDMYRSKGHVRVDVYKYAPHRYMPMYRK